MGAVMDRAMFPAPPPPPDDAPLPHDATWLPAGRGCGPFARLPCLFAGARTARLDAQGRPEALVIYFHGNAEDLRSAAPSLRAWSARLDAPVLGAEYPYYGWTSLGCARDATGSHQYRSPAGGSADRMCIAFARSTWRHAMDVWGVPPQRIVLFGRSIGAAVAISLAAELCEAGEPPGALVALSAFASVKRLAAETMGPLVAAALCFTRERFANDREIARVTCPTLVLHGTDDEVAPCGHAVDLYEACAARVKRFRLLQGGTHNVIEAESFVLPEMLDFLRRARVFGRWIAASFPPTRTSYCEWSRD